MADPRGFEPRIFGFLLQRLEGQCLILTRPRTRVECYKWLDIFFHKKIGLYFLAYVDCRSIRFGGACFSLWVVELWVVFSVDVDCCVEFSAKECFSVSQLQGLV